MADDTVPEETRRSFRIHGGECVVSASADTVRIEQSLPRRYHPAFWLVWVASTVAAAYSLLTGWRYTAGTGALIGWRFFALVAGYLACLPVWRRAVERYRGYTSVSTVPLTAIEAVTITSTEIGWYFKTERRVPVCELRYHGEGQTRRRRFKLPLRAGRADVTAAVDAFEDAGIRVHLDLTDAAIPAAPDTA